MYRAELRIKRLDLKSEKGVKKREHRKARYKSRTQYIHKMFHELTF